MIKWRRLNKVVHKIVDRKTVITLSTDTHLSDVISAVKFNDKEVYIVLSDKCKEIDLIIKAIAHEVAHVIIGDDTHSKAFEEAWKKYEGVITTAYNK